MAATMAVFDLSSASRAAKIVKAGGLIVFPTDTVYGLGADPLNETALSRLVEAKRRESKPISILVDSLDSATKIASLSDVALSLAREYWPGALTIVAPAKVLFPAPILRGSSFVGVRVPRHELCVELVKMCGGMLTGTSANISGRPSCRTASEAKEQFGSKVDMVLDGGRSEAAESTVVRVEGAEVQVLRRGAVLL